MVAPRDVSAPTADLLACDIPQDCFCSTLDKAWRLALAKLQCYTSESARPGQAEPPRLAGAALATSEAVWRATCDKYARLLNSSIKSAKFFIAASVTAGEVLRR